MQEKQTETNTLLGVKIDIFLFLISITDIAVGEKLQELNTKTKPTNAQKSKENRR